MAGTRLKQKLTAIADTIRAKLESTELMTVDEMPPEIQSIDNTSVNAIISRSIQLGDYTNTQVTRIGAFVFRGMGRYIRSVNFPNVTIISEQAFHSCTGLTNIYFNNAEQIGQYAFFSCSGLTNISLPKCTKIDRNAFQNCTNLATITFEEITEVITLGASAFSGCSNLIGFYVPDALVTDFKNDSAWSEFENIIFGLSDRATDTAASVPPPAPLQITPIDRLDIDEINIDRDLDLDPDLDLENERN